MAIVRIAGVTLPQQKRIEISLMYIYGVGRPLANKILTATQVDPQKRTHALTDDEANRIREEVKNYRVEGDLRREVLMNVTRLREISSYRGSRHGKRLPVRGQRTKTNSRTVRGNVRKTMGSGKKPSTQKT